MTLSNRVQLTIELSFTTTSFFPEVAPYLIASISAFRKESRRELTREWLSITRLQDQMIRLIAKCSKISCKDTLYGLEALFWVLRKTSNVSATRAKITWRKVPASVATTLSSIIE